MTDKILIFGNGLGRSFDNEFYSLTRVLNEAWDDPFVLSDVQKHLICNCLDSGVIEGELVAPTGEEQLANLQTVLNACDTISRFENDEGDPEKRWLTEHGLQFPQAIRRYFHDASSRFHSPEMLLPEAFAESLRNVVLQNCVHIATLNYDDLLYDCFTGTDVFNKHVLRDGFFNGAFDFDTHHNFWNPWTEGWFLHLHGSPLFVNIDGDPHKITRAQLGDFQGNDSTHLVLTNASSKPSVISSSKILRTYWKQLGDLLKSQKEVVLFGYGGGDRHLNQLLAKTKSSIKIRVVCRSGEKSDEEITEFWTSKLAPKDASDISITTLEKLIEFDDW